MERRNFDKQSMLALLHKGVVPALGCTEPVCAAIAAADAAASVGGEIYSVMLKTSPGLYKNGCSVGIAGFDQVGLDYAAALGALIAKSQVGLEIMKFITPSIAQKAKELVGGGNVKVMIDSMASGVYAHCTVTTSAGYGESIISGAHINIVKRAVNGNTIFEKVAETAVSEDNLLQLLQDSSVPHIKEIVSSASDEELDFLMDGVDMNYALAEYGFTHNPGIGIAGVLHTESGGDIWGNSLIERVVNKVTAATEVRLEGCHYSTMSSAGSGSKGIAVILPVVETANEIKASRSKLLHGLAFGHLLNEYINRKIGKLAPVCTCAIASCTAASAAVTWLMGGTDEQIGFAIRNMTGSIAGMLCDGGKVGCALKLSTATYAAMFSAMLAVSDVGLRPTDGICAVTPEECIPNFAKIGAEGMKRMD
ncbi:MAG: L-serine ammonia-lyase, iron-sulfur-dependent, subunit alpha [Clostridiales bacterium]|nr:L-serine ammonia-lyase, iron-sulfur-dependent, subunit alpha [Clostridiales bacterium]